jgi:hypothetical protein
VWLEHAWDGRRSLCRSVYVDIVPIATEHDNIARCGRDRWYPKSGRPLRMVLHAGETGEPCRWEDPRRQETGYAQHARSVSVEGMLHEARSERHDGLPGAAELAPHPPPVVFARWTRDHLGEVVWFDSGSHRRADCRPGRCSDDQFRIVCGGVEGAFDSAEHACVEHPAVGSTGAKHDGNSFGHTGLNHRT